MCVTPWSFSARTTISAPVSETLSRLASRVAVNVSSFCIVPSKRRTSRNQNSSTKDKGAFPPLDRTPSTGDAGSAPPGRQPSNKYDRVCHGETLGGGARAVKKLNTVHDQNVVIILLSSGSIQK